MLIIYNIKTKHVAHGVLYIEKAWRTLAPSCMLHRPVVEYAMRESHDVAPFGSYDVKYKNIINYSFFMVA